MKRTSGGHSGSQKVDRGNSPQLGVVLLFVLVFIGGAMVLVTGVTLLDTIEAESEAEHTRGVMNEDDHCIETALMSGEPCVVQSDRVVSDGRMEFTWWGDRSENETVTVDPLGSLEYEHRDRTFASQAGGQWELTDDGSVRILQSPGIGYDDGTLNLNIRSIDSDDSGSGEKLARSDAQVSSALQEELEAAAGSDHPNVTITIESEYHEAWNAHFQTAFGPDEYENVSVSHDPSEETVTAEILEISETTSEGPYFEVTEDHGIVDSDEQVVENGSQFQLEATITNTGNERGSQEARAIIDPEGIAAEQQNTVNLNNLDPGDSVTRKFTFSAGEGNDHYQNELETGNTYEYLIKTDNDTTDDPPGSFYYGEPDTEFNVSETTATVGEDNVTIEADLQNIGVKNDTQNLTLKLDPGLDHDNYEDVDFLNDEGNYTATIEANRTFGESDTISWTMNKSVLIEGDYEYTIEPEDDPENAVGDAFVIDVGVDPGDTELEFDGNGTVDVTLLGAETSIEPFFYESDLPSEMEHDGETYPTHVQNLIPIDLEVVFEDRDTGEELRRETPWVNDGENINTREMRHEVDESELTESYDVSNAVMTISATSYGPPRWYGVPCDTGWTEPSPDDPYRFVDGGEGWQAGGDGLWFDRECDAMTDEWESVDVAGGDGDGQVRVRSAENNTMPELRGYHPGQMSADEILPEGMYTGEEDADGNPLLDLDSNEFLYLFEVTTNPEAEGEDPDEFFEAAQDTDGSGDPNFNDIIVHVEVQGEGAPEDLGNPFLDGEAGGDNPIKIGVGESDSGTGSGSTSSGAPNVDVGTDHIVIG